MGLDGIEPSTSELSALRSNRLSYSPVPARLAGGVTLSHAVVHAQTALLRTRRTSGATSKITVPPSWDQLGGTVPSFLLGKRDLDAADEVRTHVVDERSERGQRGEEHHHHQANGPGRADDRRCGDLDARLPAE